jgi:hypothetical protein
MSYPPQQPYRHDGPPVRPPYYGESRPPGTPWSYGIHQYAPPPSESRRPSGGAIAGAIASIFVALFLLLNAVVLYVKHSEGDAGSEQYPFWVAVLVVLALISVFRGIKGIVGKRR